MRRSLVATASVLAIGASSLAFAQTSGQQGTPAQPAQQKSQATVPATPSTTTQQAGSNAMPAKADATIALILIAPAATGMQPVSPDALYKGFRADQLIGQDVYGPKGNQLGEVQEILVGQDGQITSVVVEGGGFLEIGDAAFRIPWKEVDLTPGKDGVVARNMTETKAENLGLFDGADTVLTGPREFRVGELTGDWALLRGGQGYGYVSGVVFSTEGRAMSVLVNRDARHGAGLYAYPYYGYNYGWDPALSYYALPFESFAVAANAPKVDAKRFDKAAL